MRSNYVALFKILTWIYAGANKDNKKHKEAKDNRGREKETTHCLLTSVACATVGPISSAARHFRHKIKFSILYSVLLLSCSSSAATAPRGSVREAGQLASATAKDPTQILPAVCLRVYKINSLAASVQCAPLACGQGNSKRPDSTWNCKKKSREFLILIHSQRLNNAQVIQSGICVQIWLICQSRSSRGGQREVGTNEGLKGSTRQIIAGNGSSAGKIIIIILMSTLRRAK